MNEEKLVIAASELSNKSLVVGLERLALALKIETGELLNNETLINIAVVIINEAANRLEDKND